MLHFSILKSQHHTLLLLLGVLFACRISCAKKRVCRFRHYPFGTLNLGLDLQGGSHLLLSVDTDTVQRERLEDLTSDIPCAVNASDIGLSRVAGGVSVTIRDSGDMEKAASVLQRFGATRYASVLTSFGNTPICLLKIRKGKHFLLVTEDAIAARNTRTVQQSIEIIRRRVDELGTTEPTIQRQGEKRILVQVPGG